MSAYGLIKATSKAMRGDTIFDLMVLNNFLANKGLPTILAYGQSVRALENSVALGIENLIMELPTLERGVSFYRSILIEIKESERQKFDIKNPSLIK